MRNFLLLVLLGLAVWTAVAIALLPGARKEDGIPLVWATDPNPQRDPQVAAFNRLHPECRLSIDPDNMGVMKVIVQSSAGIGPDLIDHIFESNVQTYFDAGILWDITDAAKRMGFGPDTLHESVRPLVMLRDPETLQDRQFLYPCNVFHDFIIYNKDIFDRLGVPYPPEDLTWERYIELAQKLTVYSDTARQVPDIFGGGGASDVLCIWDKGGDVLNKDGTRCTLGAPEAVAGMQFLHDLHFTYGVEPTPVQRAGVTSQGGWASAGMYNWFGEGRVAMYIGARWQLIQMRRFFTEQLSVKRKWEAEHPGETYQGRVPPRLGACLVPRFANGRRYTSFGARCTGINKMSPHREQALQFLQYLASEEYSELICKGGDARPGNEAYASLERLRHPDWPGEEEVNRVSILAVADGRLIPRSFFINTASVMRILWQATSRIQASPDLTPADIERLMVETAARIDLEIANSIERDPKLRRAYERMLQAGAEPIALALKKRGE